MAELVIKHFDSCRNCSHRFGRQAERQDKQPGGNAGGYKDKKPGSWRTDWVRFESGQLLAWPLPTSFPVVSIYSHCIMSLPPKADERVEASEQALLSASSIVDQNCISKIDYQENKDCVSWPLKHNRVLIPNTSCDQWNACKWSASLPDRLWEQRPRWYRIPIQLPPVQWSQDMAERWECLAVLWPNHARRITHQD